MFAFCFLKVYGQMDKENMYTHTGMLFSLEKQGCLAICDNMDESEGHLLSAMSQIQ